jgi:hypothetical protein
MSQYYLAIDPGAKGAFAAEIHGGIPIVKSLSDPPTSEDFTGYLWTNTTAVIEDIPMGGWGPIPQSTVAKLHQGYGRLLGILEVRGIRTIKVKPQEWQKACGAGTKKYHGKDWKKHLAQIAKERFPCVEFKVEQADSLLILDYAIRAKL